MVSYLSRYNESQGWYVLGEGIPVVGGLESAAAAVIDPNGDRQSLGQLSSGQARFFTPTTPGFHEIRVGPDTRVVAVNPPAAESNLEVMNRGGYTTDFQLLNRSGRSSGTVVFRSQSGDLMPLLVTH